MKKLDSKKIVNKVKASMEIEGLSIDKFQAKILEDIINKKVSSSTILEERKKFLKSKIRKIDLRK